MELEVLTPIHIGGVDYKTKLNKMEYLYDPNKAILTLIDNTKFVEYLTKNRLLDKYIENLEKINLFKFLKENNIEKDIGEFTKEPYKGIEIKTEEGETKKSINDIKLLNTDIKGEFYIQGSSIKGALVGALLTDYIINNRNKFNDSKNQIILNAKILLSSYMRLREISEEIKKNKEIKNFQTNKKLFDEQKKLNNTVKEKKNNIKNEVIRIKESILNTNSSNKKIGISISDSYKTINTKSYFFQDIDRSLVNDKVKDIPLVREYIMPNAKFNFDITLDLELLAKTKLNIKSYEDLEESLSRSINYLINDIFEISKVNNENLVLGANTGFYQKTIIHALFDEQKEINDRKEVIKCILYNPNNPTAKYHLEDPISPMILNQVRLNNGKFQLAGLVKIKKIGEKNVGTN